MTAPETGQAAYEAFQRAEVSVLRSPKAREMALAGKGWDTLGGDEQAWWMIAAHAAQKPLRDGIAALAADIAVSAVAGGPHSYREREFVIALDRLLEG